MTVDFGRAKTAMYGKTKLTKQIQQGFVVKTAIRDENQLWEIAEKTCADFPRERGVFGRPRGAMVYKARADHQRMLGYGSITTTKSGSELIGALEWTLRFQNTGPSWRLYIYRARLHSGRIERATEMQYWLNEFEGALRQVDPSAEVRMIDGG